MKKRGARKFSGKNTKRALLVVMGVVIILALIVFVLNLFYPSIRLSPLPANCKSDINGDGAVDFADKKILSANYG